MGEREGDRGHENGGERGPDHDRGGPEGTEFLDLELSKVIQARGSALAREAAEELIKESVKARLKERLGERLAEVGRIAADELVDAIETNLSIEALIAARREGRNGLD